MPSTPGGPVPFAALRAIIAEGAVVSTYAF
ncbi:MAG: hypothetical protein JWM74_427 [Myxococcaceae bacterium]|nr:hypothetical protein [Myxococcaceae bacterium]